MLLLQYGQGGNYTEHSHHSAGFHNYYSVVQSPYWEVNPFSASQEILCILQNPVVHYYIYKCPLTVLKLLLILEYNYTIKQFMLYVHCLLLYYMFIWLIPHLYQINGKWNKCNEKKMKWNTEPGQTSPCPPSHFLQIYLRLITFYGPNLMSLFHCLHHSKGSVQTWETCICCITSPVLTVRSC
jgi:hypothetical protein